MFQRTLLLGVVSVTSGVLMAVGFHLGQRLCEYCESPRFKDDVSKACDFGEKICKNVSDGLSKASGSFVNTTEV